MTKLEIYKEEYYFYKNRVLNSVHGVPAYQHICNNVLWWENGRYHGLNGPAVIYPSGEKMWYENGKYIKTEYLKNG